MKTLQVFGLGVCFVWNKFKQNFKKITSNHTSILETRILFKYFTKEYFLPKI